MGRHSSLVISSFEFKVNITAGTNSINIYPWALTNTVDDLQAIDDASGDFLGIKTAETLGDTTYNLILEQVSGGTTSLGGSVTINPSTDYYVTIVRDDDANTLGQLYLNVYTDEERKTHAPGSPVATNLIAQDDFRYLFAVNTRKQGAGGVAFSGTFSDYRLGYTSITGLSHLEGETVQVLGDGSAQASKTVSSGAITAAAQAFRFVVGKGFTGKMVTPRLEAGARTGTAQGRIQSINMATVRLHEALELDIGIDGEDDLTSADFDTTTSIPSLSGVSVPDAYGVLFSGDQEEIGIKRGSGRTRRIQLQSGDPTPFGIIAIMPQLTTEEY